jgi:hypothetical protein
MGHYQQWRVETSCATFQGGVECRDDSIPLGRIAGADHVAVISPNSRHSRLPTWEGDWLSNRLSNENKGTRPWPAA